MQGFATQAALRSGPRRSFAGLGRPESGTKLFRAVLEAPRFGEGRGALQLLVTSSLPPVHTSRREETLVFKLVETKLRNDQPRTFDAFQSALSLRYCARPARVSAMTGAEKHFPNG
jgi:hypothetical protein